MTVSRTSLSWSIARARTLAPSIALLLGASLTACATTGQAGGGAVTGSMSTTAPNPDPRVGLSAGLMNAGEATWNMRVLSKTPSPEHFLGVTNSDLAFSGKYAFQGNYNGYQVWDISNPRTPSVVSAYLCPASQSDVSVYKNLIFVSGEGLSGRLDCGTQGVKDTVSAERLRGLRIFDITDIRNPKNVANVQTCRGSHTHTLLVDPKDTENVYVYISGSSGVRSPSELAGCVSATPDKDPNSALFRIEVIKIPLAHPERAAIVSSPRIFNDLVAPPVHGPAAEDLAAAAKALAEAKKNGAFIATVSGTERVMRSSFVGSMLDSIVKARNGTGSPTSADSAALRTALPAIAARLFATPVSTGPRPGPTQCHDITVYPAVGLAGGACGGYGLLLDISNPANPVRIAAAADSNFAYWHSATFNNDGNKVLFSDEWGGGGQPKCRASDKPEWGSDAIFTIVGGKMNFQSYYKLPAAQTAQENCVAHNGSLIPIPGRDIMVQAWYQGGVSVFEWTDPKHPKEIAFFDRGPVNAATLDDGGSWSAYWYNGVIVSSEISRGLDIMELTPSGFISKNEIEAAKSVVLREFNAQNQPKFTWPASFALARAYVDQLERSNGLSASRIAEVRESLVKAERQTASNQRSALLKLSTELEGYIAGSNDQAKAQRLAGAVRQLAEPRVGITTVGAQNSGN